MSRESASRRRRERQEIKLPLEVHCRESTEDEWDLTAQLLDVSPFGARILLARPTEPGRLLHLSLPLPRQLRCYDHEQENYLIWALVRHARILDSEDDRAPSCEIGVAFVGREPPSSFVTDPARHYLLAKPSTEDSLWAVRESPESSASEKGSDERRMEQRYSIEEEVTIEVYDAKGGVHTTETTTTRNISQRGMCVRTTLNLVRGRYIRVRSPQFRIAVIAAVRRLRRDTDGSKYLHLEFIDQQWPPLLEQNN